jgi:hypothetical protein
MERIDITAFNKKSVAAAVAPTANIWLSKHRKRRFRKDI